jgi:hypothetical protein
VDFRIAEEILWYSLIATMDVILLNVIRRNEILFFRWQTVHATFSIDSVVSDEYQTIYMSLVDACKYRNSLMKENFLLWRTLI